MRIRRSRLTADFVQIPNRTARHEQLGYMARGILLELLSRPDGWEATANDLWLQARKARGESAESRRQIESAFAELKTAGYLVASREQREGGRFTTVLTLHDMPVSCSDVPPAGASARPAETDVPAGRTDIPTAGMSADVTGIPACGTSVRPAETNVHAGHTDIPAGGVSVPPGKTGVSAGRTDIPTVGMSKKKTVLENGKENSLGEPDRQAAPAVVSTVEEREDHQGEGPTPTIPGIPAKIARRVMGETGATAEELARIVAEAGRDGVRRPGPWLLSETGAADFLDRLAALRSAPSATRSGPPGVGDYRQAIRAACEEHGTPGGSARCALCRTQAPAQPPVVEEQDLEVPTPRGNQPTPAPEQDRSGSPTTSGRDTSIADARAQLAKLNTKPIRRRTTPTRLQPSPTETPTAVTAAHTYLNSCGDGLEWVETAREKLGGADAPRDEVMVLAATLAHEHHDRLPVAR